MVRLLLKSMRRNITSLSLSKRPPFYEVFPQRRMVNKILFDLDSRLTSGTLCVAYESIYNNLDKDSYDAKVPNNFTASDVMIMKKVLEKVRHRTKSVNKYLLSLENVLLDKAAEMGNKDAVSLLAFDVLNNPANNTLEDVEYAKLLIKDLYKRKHHLTLKLTGDLAFKGNDFTQAKSYYKQFLNLEDDTFLAGEVYGKLGIMYFQESQLLDAEKAFLKSIQFSPLEFSVKSYYYLAQMNLNSDPVKARVLMESCATQGFKEAFKALGYLEMNYFKDLNKAQEWFRLGMELFELECFIGCFDCCCLLHDWSTANKCYKSMQKMAQLYSHYQLLLAEFDKSRHERIMQAAKYDFKPIFNEKLVTKAKQTVHSPSRENKWGL